MTCRLLIQHRLRPLLIVAAAALPFVSGACHDSQNKVNPTPSRAPDEESLRGAVTERYTALKEQDWPRVYQTFDPAYQSKVSLEAYLEERKTMGIMFQFLDFHVGKVETMGNWGWVEMEQVKMLPRFPDNPPEITHTWEKWKRVESRWYPCAADESRAMPVEPSARLLAEEPALAARVEAYCTTRLTKDLSKLAEYINPPDRDKLTGPDVAGGRDDPTNLVGYKIDWVEVLPTTSVDPANSSQQGRARISYENKERDPSQSKLPSTWIGVTELWIKVDGVWYRDLP